jgi:hypothetical protein
MAHWVIEDSIKSFLGIFEADDEISAYDMMLDSIDERIAHPIEIPHGISIRRAIKTTVGKISGAHVEIFVDNNIIANSFWGDDYYWDGEDRDIEVFLPDRDYNPLYPHLNLIIKGENDE